MISLTTESERVSASYTCYDSVKSSKDDFIVSRRGVFRKKACRCVWCPECWQYFHAPKITERLQLMDRRRVRHLVFSIDREKCSELIEAVGLFHAGKLIERIMRGKKIKQGAEWVELWDPRKCLSYVWWMEFHEDGIPHWHVVIETDRTGKSAMIGGDRLRHYWPYGGVREEFIRDEKHWERFCGYDVKKSGYAGKDKSYQGHLPEVLRGMNAREIRRWGHSRDEKESKNELKDSEADNLRKLGKYFSEQSEALRVDESEKKERGRSSYSAILGSCGSHTLFKFEGDVCGEHIEVETIVARPYVAMREGFEGHYEPGVGYKIELAAETLETIICDVVKVLSIKARDSNVVYDWIKRRSKYLDRVNALLGQLYRHQEKIYFSDDLTRWV